MSVFYICKFMNMDMSTPIRLGNYLYKLSDFRTKKKFIQNVSIIFTADTG